MLMGCRQQAADSGCCGGTKGSVFRTSKLTALTMMGSQQILKMQLADEQKTDTGPFTLERCLQKAPSL